MASPTFNQLRDLVNARIDSLSLSLHQDINKKIHANPELAFKEFFAHDLISSYLESLGFKVQRSSHELETSFDSSIGAGGRQVVFCCEYDALPGIGHACGHNLIATSSIAAFLGAAHALVELKLPGRIRILGTPAEESGGGKAVLIDNGAFNPPEDIAAAIMAHPLATHSLNRIGAEYSGLAGLIFLASYKFRVEFRGKNAHAAGEPWNGVNALDAAVQTYTNISMMRQQIRPDERMHGIIESGGQASNIIPDYTRMSWGVRAPTLERAEKLFQRAKACCEASALATGCTVEIIQTPTYANLRANETLCKAYVEDMAAIGEQVHLHQDKPFTASTDMGNVSHLVPSFHGAFAVPTAPGVALHSPQFATAAATHEGHDAAIKCSKGMALLALRLLVDEDTAKAAWADFELPDDIE
ncbi:Hypothetical protein R9X50_00443200 [Acrodontium crateriforme]|uniref:Peptidase M20 domain-containing protein 2 n=1 Tax=Acrodontium crateriforme TaxID=150365 RepID=A0AAQ3M5D8_9PEZI|nr:Hypothetical protein R9X50_00443200 [Acrodontium crateriforme]